MSFRDCRSCRELERKIVRLDDKIKTLGETNADLLRENAELRTAFNYELGVRKLLEKRITEIRVEDRETCAKLIEGYCDCVSDLPCDYCGELHEIAKAVRALSGDIQS